MEADRTAFINKMPQDEVDHMDDLDTVPNQFDQVVTLVGQVINSLSYWRHNAILNTVLTNDDQRRVKDVLKENRALFEEDDNYLFGSKFEELVVKTQKTKVKTKEMLAGTVASGCSE